MKTETINPIIAIYIITALILGAGFAAALPVPNEKTTDTTRILITLDSGITGDKVIKAVEENGGKFVRKTLNNELIFIIPTNALNNRISILNIPGAAYIEEDRQIKLPTPQVNKVTITESNIQLSPNDPLYPRQWGIPMIGANKSWDITTGDKKLIVAVVDTGVDYTHEDLASVNKSIGWDFVNNDANALDDEGHGTHVAGIIAATMNNGKGVVGIAPNITVMPVKVLDSTGSGFESDVADGIRWAANHGAKIISLSLGGDLPDLQTYEAARYAFFTKGALVIAAAGNSGKEAPSYPGAYPFVLGVGALDSTSKRAYYSQYGNFLDIMAPGSNIISTVPKGTCELCDPSGYSSLSGTSMATPYVSGVAALYWSHNMSLTNKQVAYMLLKSADDLGTPGWDKYYGYGRVDAYPQDG